MQARIDSHNKVLLAQDVDQRSQIFSKAVEMCDMYQRRAKMLLLRSAILKANISVKVFNNIIHQNILCGKLKYLFFSVFRGTSRRLEILMDQTSFKINCNI